MTELTFLKELMLIGQGNQKSAISNAFFLDEGLIFNRMYEINAMIY